MPYGSVEAAWGVGMSNGKHMPHLMAGAASEKLAAQTHVSWGPDLPTIQRDPEIWIFM